MIKQYILKLENCYYFSRIRRYKMIWVYCCVICKVHVILRRFNQIVDRGHCLRQFETNYEKIQEIGTFDIKLSNYNSWHRLLVNVLYVIPDLPAIITLVPIALYYTRFSKRLTRIDSIDITLRVVINDGCFLCFVVAYNVKAA